MLPKTLSHLSFLSALGVALAFGVPLVLAATSSASDGTTIVNGQLFTSGLAIVDSPQPNTPEGGGELLHSYYFHSDTIAPSLLSSYQYQSSLQDTD